ncbi:DUF1707 and DUF2154 domain-containing protein [Bailinhaonella thermotolerans]|uniref:DUF1707 and DUF2154 domain-containing protein n=1 Tax=Bailinhaonella thermotolerans TaxID=1070861 RepID=A0A3A4B111_9ACTN|nr:DUF1707 and DUF2154 domain-containing protein [Bailinhaonella thermotolerans]
MSDLLGPGDDPAVPRPHELRAADVDRERVIEVLREAVADGRLTPAEHEERVEHCYRARTLGELGALTADLLAPDQQPVQTDVRPVVAFFGSEERKGRWVVPPRYTATAAFANVTLDMREALLQTGHARLHVNALFATITLIVPEGVRILMPANAVLGSKSNNVPPAGAENGPVIEITGTLVCSGVTAKSPKRPKLRGFAARRARRQLRDN